MFEREAQGSVKFSPGVKPQQSCTSTEQVRGFQPRGKAGKSQILSPAGQAQCHTQEKVQKVSNAHMVCALLDSSEAVMNSQGEIPP